MGTFWLGGRGHLGLSELISEHNLYESTLI